MEKREKQKGLKKKKEIVCIFDYGDGPMRDPHES